MTAKTANRRWLAMLGAAALSALATGAAATPAAPNPTAPAPATAPEAEPAERPLPPSALTTPAVPKPALWVVRDEDTTIYLFGTIHVMRAGVNWFHPRVREAFDASDELVTEIPEAEFRDAPYLFVQRAITDDGLPLTEHLDAQQLALYRRGMARVGVPVSFFEPVEPWVPTFLLMSGGTGRGSRYRADLGVEVILNRAARDRRMPVSALESLDMQIGFFDHLSMDTQVDMLMSLMHAIVEPCNCAGRRSGIDSIVNTWAHGDVEGIATFNAPENTEEPDEFYQVLLPDRNDRWSQWVQLRLNEPGGKFFVAVGAAHLAGNDSVQSFLARDGITVERIEY